MQPQGCQEGKVVHNSPLLRRFKAHSRIGLLWTTFKSRLPLRGVRVRSFHPQILLKRHKIEKYRVFEISIESAVGGSWCLPVDRITLFSRSNNYSALTGVWKAFENFLIEAGLKADLVQLNGYYQYSPQIVAKMKLRGAASGDNGWATLANITGGLCIGATLDSEEIARRLDISKRDVRNSGVFLKALGFEVRNSITNPQIPAGCYLFPYIFPTLSPKSVQLRKNLVGS